MTTHTITIATRESPLALWQANWVKQSLEILYPDLTVRLLGLTTTADKMLSVPLIEVGGKGLFVKELEEALLDGRADIAVHSMKDVPMDFPAGLCLPVMCKREDPRDAFVSNHFANLNKLPPGAIIGTSSLRRQSQILARRSDLEIVHLRGNVNTRLAKLDDNEYAAIILAAAGLRRLDLETRIRTFFSLDESLPAAGQGVLGIECREDDSQTLQLISSLNHAESKICVTAERALCKRLGGGCQVPIAAYAQIDAGKLHLKGLVAKIDGSLILRAERTSPLGQTSEKNFIARRPAASPRDPEDRSSDSWIPRTSRGTTGEVLWEASDEIDHAEKLGVAVAEELLRQGAGEILNCLLKKI